MSAPALKALAAAKTAGVKITLDGDGLVFEANPLPSDIVALLKTVKHDLLRILAGREAARTAANLDDLRKLLIRDGWSDQATLLGWTAEELYRVPPVWARVDLTGAALMTGDRRVIAVTGTSIALEALSGSRLKFRRIGREHLA